MTVSGVTTALDTVQDIVRDALIELQIYSANKQPSDPDMQLGRRRLQWMLKEWQDDGVNLWRREDVTIDWLAATPEATLAITVDGDPVAINDILSLRYVSGYERELTRWEMPDYLSLPNKTAPGAPTCYAITRELTGVRLRLWPVPAANTTLLASVNRVINDVTSLTETVDVPAQYTRTVMMNLAASLASAFGRASDPNTILTVQEASSLYKTMRGADRPASYFIQSAGQRP